MNRKLGELRSLRQWLVIFALLQANTLFAEESSRQELIPVSLLSAYGATELVEMDCKTGTPCSAKCSSGPGHVSFSYNNVRQLSYTVTPEMHLVAMVYFDPHGKTRQVFATLPKAVSCLYDDLDIESVSPLIDGKLQRSSRDDVVFELLPDS